MEILFFILLFFVAFLYASVGHGGASGYLALLAIFNVSAEVMRPTALLLNLFVSLTAFIQFYRGGHFRLSLFLPFAAASVPMAFIGGLLMVDTLIYKQILGCFLILAALRFLFFEKIKVENLKKENLPVAVMTGGAIGFLSGLIGVGGGIILSPLLLLLRWVNMKQTAAISALFIFVNSAAGLTGQLIRGAGFTGDMLAYVVISFVGGAAGAWFGAFKFKQPILMRILSVVLFIAAYKLLFMLK